MTNLYRIESAVEMGDHVAVTLVNQNGETSLHMFTPGEFERISVDGAPLSAWRLPAHEQTGPLPPRWLQKLAFFTYHWEAL